MRSGLMDWYSTTTPGREPTSDSSLVFAPPLLRLNHPELTELLRFASKLLYRLLNSSCGSCSGRTMPMIDSGVSENCCPMSTANGYIRSLNGEYPSFRISFHTIL